MSRYVTAHDSVFTRFSITLVLQALNTGVRSLGKRVLFKYKCAQDGSK